RGLRCRDPSPSQHRHHHLNRYICQRLAPTLPCRPPALGRKLAADAPVHWAKPARWRVKKCPQDAAEVLPRQHSCTPTRNGVRGGNERNRTHGASSKVGFLDSGNGTPPRCLK
ncbi:hypothetical protein JOQ06_003671, partial [Pogonophryne albipinna]